MAERCTSCGAGVLPGVVRCEYCGCATSGDGGSSRIELFLREIQRLDHKQQQFAFASAGQIMVAQEKAHVVSVFQIPRDALAASELLRVASQRMDSTSGQMDYNAWRSMAKQCLVIVSSDVVIAQKNAHVIRVVSDQITRSEKNERLVLVGLAVFSIPVLALVIFGLAKTVGFL